MMMNYDKRNLRFDLPGLLVEDSTTDVLTSLLAYEQSLIDSGGEFSMYVVTMGSLIKS